ncbi:MAG TPA: hypothetical protein VEF04_07080 [Blastocatellia bacterium]|nr:hypothetical protein [Blastocatellia bacterium]
MASLLLPLLYLLVIGSFVCQIIVVIKLFQEKGPLHGILGIICGLYPLIWGWINVDRLKIRNIMLIWTGIVILTILLQIISAVLAVGQATLSQ